MSNIVINPGTTRSGVIKIRKSPRKDMLITEIGIKMRKIILDGTIKAPMGPRMDILIMKTGNKMIEALRWKEIPVRPRKDILVTKIGTTFSLR